MLIFLLSTSFIMSLLIMSLKHPLSMGVTLLTQTITISLIIGLFSFNFWFSYILFLVMIGGMLVLFIYMTSVASNEMFKYSYKLLNLMIIIFLITMLLLMYMDPFFTYMSTISMESTSYSPNLISMSMNKYFYPTNFIMYMIILYLLITLIAIVKITDISQGPLRQTSN
uniref:NADH-ubiquinone oxidoreductase chain 6 n=1 Tax=Aphodius sp. APH01 TaxID=1205671 RepID=A0A0S2MN79_9SCAR|nr:NADH deshydrogenase subunit 6 [Aphodius sp. APH01]